MSDPGDKDVFGKADALLRRHSAVGEDTTPVPLLTDLVDPAAAPPPVAAAPAADPAGDLATEVFHRVLAQVEGRLAADLERRLAQVLSIQAREAAAAALDGLRPELSNAIAEAVAEALRARQVK